jgi:hypothetical protein
MKNSFEASKQVENLLLDNVAKIAWEKELVTKF